MEITSTFNWNDITQVLSSFELETVSAIHKFPKYVKQQTLKWELFTKQNGFSLFGS